MNISSRDAAGAACRNAYHDLQDIAENLRKTCLHAFSEPAEIPAEFVIALNDIKNAAELLNEAADAYYAAPDVETIEAMRHIRQQAARDAAERERRRKNG